MPRILIASPKGLSKRLVDDFIRPTLLVGLFKSAEELSAAVAMELLYFYALAHQTSFDVRWIKSKSVQENLIQPLAEQVSSRSGSEGVCHACILILPDPTVHCTSIIPDPVPSEMLIMPSACHQWAEHFSIKKIARALSGWTADTGTRGI